MSTPLLYTHPLPLDAKKHAHLGLRPNLGMGFARRAHAVPINLIEFPQIASLYPIVFAQDTSATPVAVLGLTEHENLFVDALGAWAHNWDYIPSYVRRYPFLLASIEGSDQMTLCIDDNADILQNNGDQRFFDDQGAPSVMTRNAMEFCKSFHAATLATQEFCAALEASGLLAAREAEIPLGHGETLRFAGFRVIDEAKWSALPDATLLEWRKKGWLPAIYAALFSGRCWGNLARLYATRHHANAA